MQKAYYLAYDALKKLSLGWELNFFLGGVLRLPFSEDAELLKVNCVPSAILPEQQLNPLI